MKFSALVTVAATTVALLATGCTEPEADNAAQPAGSITFDLSPAQSGRIRVAKVDAIAAEVPKAIRDRGTLVVTGAAGAAPPLRFYATDDKTVVGSEVDFASLIADILGLKLDARVADWSQNFVRVDSGEVDAFISNVTVTEERKEKYDFATYRKDNVALEVPIQSKLDYKDRTSLAGKRIGVGSGTNQEQLLVKWNEQNRAEGLAPIDIAYFQQVTDYYLALASQRLDGYLGPNPTAIYHAATAKQTRIVGTFSGAGEALQGEIAVLTKKDNGLITAVQHALAYAIEHGAYQQVIDRWGLQSETVTESRINPPGLPKKR
ncbi:MULTISPECIES: ABC transporter substrate-binding protein [Nocardia]|uniref:ABC transporter substrate-binding protein n=1 Tax=Nocardia implantans TaxID=3108168 RepID=A0ABU6AR52_9NOCA|nr:MULTISPECIES: ABC transporter substrate-binding protein [unclassified Nocardia]MBF6190218.1 ABC transporter substrate-binding protein [Nocardia beijingensis]MEA3532744.1 ABC transporter substrate-binding protein [Nocardia sp. CDC192]MEB3509875.1 ABC transporter substrate-binding protein [Nocardia sp. CDC186]